MAEIKIATRRSSLARAQAIQIGDALAAAHPGLVYSLVEVTTSGDRDRSSPVATLTEVGAFVRAVQQAVLDGEADIAVHSCKDIPVDGPSELIPSYPERAEPWDVLCGHDLDNLPHRARVGTGSPRRAAQLELLRPDVEISHIRGNVDTRLEKLRAGEFDAVVLAEAGLARLGREDEIRHRFSIEEMVPAPAQAVIAAEALKGSPAAGLLATIDHSDTRAAVEAERALLEHTRAGCRSALGALGMVDGSVIRLTGFVSDDRGPRRSEVQGSDPDQAARLLQMELGL